MIEYLVKTALLIPLHHSRIVTLNGEVILQTRINQQILQYDPQRLKTPIRESNPS